MNGAYSGEMADQDLHEAGTLVAQEEDGAAGVAAPAAPVAPAAPAAVRAGSVVRSEHMLGLHLKQGTNRSCVLKRSPNNPKRRWLQFFLNVIDA